MFSSLMHQLQSNQNVTATTTRSDQERATSSAGNFITTTGRSGYSVKEIAETIPEFDPTNESSVSVEQFVERVNSAVQAYQWEEKCFLLAVYSRLKDAAKLWLDSTEKLYSSWSELSKCLCEEFSCVPDEADIHFKMSQTTRKPNESLLDYCFRIGALGKRFGLSESSIVKYARDGIKQREFQIAIAANRFSSMREFRQTVIDYSKNLPVRTFKPEKTNFETKYGETRDGEKRESDKQLICFNCQQKGHISLKCPQPQRRRRCNDCQKVHPKTKPENCGKKSASTRTTKTEYETVIPEKDFEKVVTINDKTFTALIDTGSECSMITQTGAGQIKGVEEKCALKISGFCGGVIYAHSRVRVNLKVDGIEQDVYLYIVGDTFLTVDVLLGQDVFKNMQMVISDGKISVINVCNKNVNLNNSKIINDDEIKCGIDENDKINKLVSLINKYRNVFATDMSEIGRTELVKMKIDLDTINPIVQKPFRVPEPKNS
ncbi:uncharacterized protein [Eurosta solidaginis]|uniref:uncharacterized protein n=1 Tax=Eurosta solidaginis TaxID=178769 RepID=UPI0035317DAC